MIMEPDADGLPIPCNAVNVLPWGFPGAREHTLQKVRKGPGLVRKLSDGRYWNENTNRIRPYPPDAGDHR